MLCRTGCAGLAAFSALIAMSTLAASDSSDLRPIGVCVDKPGTGTFVGDAGWTSCNEPMARREAKREDLPRALPEAVAAQASQSLREPRFVRRAAQFLSRPRLIFLTSTTTPSLSKRRWASARDSRTVQCTRLIQLRRNAALSRRRGGVAPGLAIGLSKRQPPRIKQHAVMCARTSVRLDHRSGCQFVANGDRRP